MQPTITIKISRPLFIGKFRG